MSDIILENIKKVRKEAMNLSLLTDEERNALLERMAIALEENGDKIREANKADLANAEESGISSAVLHRLLLSEEKLASAIASVRSVASLPSPLGKVKEKRELDDGFVLEKVSFPLGVIGMIFEARPDAFIQIVSLAIKSGNGIILKGGKEAILTNRELAKVIASALDGAPWMLLLESHADVSQMLKAEGDIDLVIPRGSNSFVRYVMDNTHIPVMGHADGICSIYVDKSAELEKAVNIVRDAKITYPAACNAVETVLVNKEIASAFLPLLKSSLDKEGVKIHGDECVQSIIECLPATEEDFHTEYLGLELAVKVVSTLDEAIEHIGSHGSHHTDAILTQSEENIKRFFSQVDSADVFANCSTRFADGFRFGLGAEVGISTSKLHARGPVGLEGLTTTKWLLRGNGNLVATYLGANARPFTHKELLGLTNQ